MQKYKTLGEILREPVRNASKFLSYPQGALGIFPSRKLALSRIGDTRDEIRNPFRSCMNDLAPSAIPLEDGEREKESIQTRENAREGGARAPGKSRNFYRPRIFIRNVAFKQLSSRF